jgi:hypothetical protein
MDQLYGPAVERSLLTLIPGRGIDGTFINLDHFASEGNGNHYRPSVEGISY